MGKDNSTLTNEKLTLIAAIVAALASVFGVIYATWSQSNLDEKKWLQARRDDAEKEQRLAIADLAAKLAKGSQKMAWVTWKAKYEPESFSSVDITTYNKEINELFSEISASHLVVAAMNKSAYDKVTPMVYELYDTDSKIALSGAKFRQSKQDGLAELQRLADVTSSYGEKLPKEMVNIINIKHSP